MTAEQVEQKKQQLKQLSEEKNAIIKELQEAGLRRRMQSSRNCRRPAHGHSTKPTSTRRQEEYLYLI